MTDRSPLTMFKPDIENSGAPLGSILLTFNVTAHPADHRPASYRFFPDCPQSSCPKLAVFCFTLFPFRLDPLTLSFPLACSSHFVTRSKGRFRAS